MLPCPTCGANIEPPNDELTLAACVQCGGLFEWPLVSEPAPVLDRPARIVVERRDGKVHAIRQRGSVLGAVLAVAAAVVVAVVAAHSLWLAFLALVWFGILFSRFLGRALGMRINLGPVVAIRNGLEPLRRFGATSITQPFVRRVDRGSLSDRYDLCAVQSDGTIVTLVGGFRSSAEARYVELELEAALGIADAPVPGEADGDAYWVDEGAPLQPLRLACPACGTVMKASDLQLRRGQAVCPGCRNGIVIGGPVAAGSRALVMLPPPSVVVDRSADAFALEAPFRSSPRAAVGPRVQRSAVSVGREVAAWAVIALVIGRNVLDPVERPASSLMSVVGLVFLALVFSTRLLSRLRVRIRGANGMLHVRVGPTWLRAPRVVSIAEIAQVFVREQPYSRLIDHRGHLQLCVLDRDGRVTPLVGWLRDLGEARSLEEQLERILGIEDAPVPGEIEGKTPQQLVGAPSLPGSGDLSLPDASAGGELSVSPKAGALSDPE